MSNLYSEYETNQVRQQESGQSYQYPPAVGQAHHNQQPAYHPQQPGYAVPAAEDTNSGRNMAFVLIGLGLLGFLNGWFGNSRVDIESGLVLFTISSGFLFFAFWRRIYGLLIPGSILAGLAFGVPFADLTNGVSVLWGLAAGFFAIDIIGRTTFGVRGSWGSIVAMVMFAVGMIVFAANLPSFLAGLGLLIPAGLIGTGIWLGQNRRSHHP